MSREFLRNYPNEVFGYKALGTTLVQSNKYEEAVSVLQKILILSDKDSEIHNSLGVAFNGLGKHEESLAQYKKALKIKPDYAEAYNNSGNALKDLGKHKESLAQYKKALKIKPDYAEAYNNMGAALQELGQHEESLAQYKKALKIKPDYAEAYNNLGSVLKELGKYEESFEQYNKALEIKPDYAEVYNNIGVALQELGKHEESLAQYKKALKIKPDYAEVYNNIGVALQELGKHEDSLAQYNKALEIKPDFAEAYNNIGTVLKESGYTSEALDAFKKSMNIKETILNYIYLLQLLPIIAKNVEDIIYWRQRLIKFYGKIISGEIAGVLSWNKSGSIAYYLAYHNFNDRIIMENLYIIYKKILQNNIKFNLSTSRKPHGIEKSPKIRIGIISEFLKFHTIGKLNIGFLKNIDRSKFEVYVFHFSRYDNDIVQAKINKLADKVFFLNGNFEMSCRAVISQRLDVIFYPEIGMSFKAYSLACFRLAMVQVVSWGHPDTTGLKSIDYFYSSKLIEPQAASKHYSERLILANRLPCHYSHLMRNDVQFNKKIFNFPAACNIYGCPQSLFKIHPDFDRILQDICVKDKNGYIVMIHGKYKEWTTLLRKRWQRYAPFLLDKVIFLDHMSINSYIQLLDSVDILLDPIYFGSGNTFYEAMLVGTPVVTFPGKFMRGRIVAGAYVQMKIINPPIAEQLNDYAQIATALVNDKKRLLSLKTSLRNAAKQYLFNDMLAVKELECFLENAVRAAEKGETLPNSWSPTPVEA